MSGKRQPPPRAATKPVDAAIQAKFQQGFVLHQQGKFAEAERFYEEVRQRIPNHFHTLHLLGVIALQTRRPERGVELIKRAIGVNSKIADAHSNLGKGLRDLKRLDEALASYDKAIALKPDYVEAHNNRGNLLNDLNRPEEALASIEKAIALQPDFAGAYFNRGQVLIDLKRPEEALASYQRAMALEPDFELLHGELLHTQMMICDWRGLQSQIAQLAEKIERHEMLADPFPIFSLIGSPRLQRKAAETYAHARYPRSDALPVIAKRQRGEKIRLGYFSADFRKHAGAYSMVEMFERHDHSKFEIFGFSFSPEGDYEQKSRLEPAFDKFIDVNSCSDIAVAKLARDMQIDIAIDRNGFTTYCRPGIFAARAAPLQASYKAYPGTMGTDYIDYLIADPVVVPAHDRQYYSEKIVYLPNSDQVYDSKRGISDKAVTRADVELPPGGFVFCCFNNNYKIVPEVFDCWMRILKRVDGSVLWLLEDSKAAAVNLKKEAVRRDVNPDRLCFAKRMPPAEHLARHRLAGLFLDTLPYNAHTTANDALWAGLPVLTCIGEAFAGRVAASLLKAIGLPELIAETPQDYEALAVELASHPAKLADIKRKLANNRLTTPLFDTRLFTKHIEAAYTAMYERYQADLPPDHIDVPQ